MKPGRARNNSELIKVYINIDFLQTEGAYQQPLFSLIFRHNYAFGKKQCEIFLLKNKSLTVVSFA